MDWKWETGLWEPAHPPPFYQPEKSYDWRLALSSSSSLNHIVPVSAFHDAELSDVATHIKPGLIVHAPSDPQTRSKLHHLWPAKVRKIAGYRLLLRQLGTDSRRTEFWMNLASVHLHPVSSMPQGHAKIRLPKAVKEWLLHHHQHSNEEEWKEAILSSYAKKALSLPLNWSRRLSHHLRPNRYGFHMGMRLEFLDRTYPHIVRVGRIVNMVGTRLRIEKMAGEEETRGGGGGMEEEAEEEGTELWIDLREPRIFPVGWALSQEATTKMPMAYKAHCARILKEGSSARAEEDSPPELFKYAPLCRAPPEGLRWEVGMRVEVLDAVSQQIFYPARVGRILSAQWMEVILDDKAPEDVFLLHQRSPFLFPVGFCQRHSLPLKPPSQDYLKQMELKKFKWETYLKTVKAEKAPAELFDADDAAAYDSSAFSEGAFIEAFETMQGWESGGGGWELSTAKVMRRIGARLLLVDFLKGRNGEETWGAEFWAFHDFRSSQLRPLGWGEAVGHPLRHPDPNIPYTWITPGSPSSSSPE